MENDKQNKQFLLLCFYLYVELNVGTVGPTAMRDGPRVELGIGLRRIFFLRKYTLNAVWSYTSVSVCVIFYGASNYGKELEI